MSRVAGQAGFAMGVFAMAGLASFIVFGGAAAEPAPAQTQVAVNAPVTASAPTVADRKQMLMQYCTACHNDRLKTAGMSVVPLDAGNLPAHLATWEKILRRLSVGEMPPRGMPRPPKEQIVDFTQWLSASLDKLAAANPDPGRATIRRMNRAEYANAVRDLLGLDIDLSKSLPVDDTGYGFDNIADILTVSPTLMDRYVNVAGKVARLATGQASRKAVTTDFKLTKDLFENAFGVPSYNERANDDLPLDSRGGGSVKFYAPYDATYTVQIYLNSGSSTESELEAGNRVEVKLPLKAGLRTIGVSFRKELALEESLIPKTTTGPRPTKPAGAPRMLPMDVQVDGARVSTLSVPSFGSGPSFQQAFYLRDVMQISLAGPNDIKGPGDTPSRRKIFICRPSAELSEADCAGKILTNLAHHAYRRPVTAADVSPLMKIYAQGRKGADFDHGIEAALEAVLVSPSFLFMRESDPAKAAPGTVHHISDTELATRLSFFLWSSIPDGELLAVAQQNRLHEPEVL
ncbi:MAG TPA: DUF1587 domain-containing protein, partial [Rhizomicrobium sp.]|nr:DUF1587 domain-containing protein [Rhizomicrobium sp.]